MNKDTLQNVVDAMRDEWRDEILDYEYDGEEKPIILDWIEEMEQAIATPPYTHRNGETQAPEVEGWYWMVSGSNDYSWIDRYDPISRTWRNLSYPIGGTRFYGPIPQPEQEQAQ